MRISIIIPIFNEEKVLTEKAQQFSNLKKQAEMIFVDGGSQDRSAEIVQDYGMVVEGAKGRAVQMNRGAQVASGEILLFLHADNMIDPETLGVIGKLFEMKNIVGGCLTQRIDALRSIYRIIEEFGNIRARLTHVFYGDQGLFVRKDVFIEMLGFNEVPIMEDVIFTRRLRKMGKTVVLPQKVYASPRRWCQKGIIQTVFLYTFINVLFSCGYPLDKLKNLYEDLR